MPARLAYAIGVAEPVAVHLDMGGGRGCELDAVASAALPAALRPRAIIDRLALTSLGFLPTAAFGRFGRPGFAWEGSAVEALLGPNLRARPFQSAHRI
jgi:S-adenosylmethionine synthetase